MRAYYVEVLGSPPRVLLVGDEGISPDTVAKWGCDLRVEIREVKIVHAEATLADVLAQIETEALRARLRMEESRAREAWDAAERARHEAEVQRERRRQRRYANGG